MRCKVCNNRGHNENNCRQKKYWKEKEKDTKVNKCSACGGQHPEYKCDVWIKKIQFGAPNNEAIAKLIDNAKNWEA